MSYKTVGVLGGMGPAATVDFLQKVIAATPAVRDQDHVPLFVHSVPQIPDRTDAISYGTDDPFPGLISGLKALECVGAEMVVMPCNTAHAWFDRLAASTDVRLLHIAEAVRSWLETAQNGSNADIALMATRGTVRAGFYQRWLRTPDRRIIVPEQSVQDEITDSIAAVKGGDTDRGRNLAASAGKKLIEAGATRLLLACTELPIAMAHTDLEDSCIDATACLAQACVSFSRSSYTDGLWC